GSAATLALVLAAIFAEQIASDPYRVDLLAVRAAPSATHPLGTDEVGRDVFSRVVHGARVSLAVGLIAVSLYTVIGVILGAVSGSYGGAAAAVLQRITDTVMCFRLLIVIIALVAMVGPSLYNVMGVIGLLLWPQVCRLVRGQFLSLREREFIEA